MVGSKRKNREWSRRMLTRSGETDAVAGDDEGWKEETNGRQVGDHPLSLYGHRNTSKDEDSHRPARKRKKINHKKGMKMAWGSGVWTGGRPSASHPSRFSYRDLPKFSCCPTADGTNGPRVSLTAYSFSSLISLVGRQASLGHYLLQHMQYSVFYTSCMTPFAIVLLLSLHFDLLVYSSI